MTKNDIFGTWFLAIFTLAAAFVWAMNIWGGWAEKTYARSKDSGSTWFWLQNLRIPNTPENCIRFIKFASALGLLAIMSIWITGLVRIISITQ